MNFQKMLESLVVLLEFAIISKESLFRAKCVKVPIFHEISF